VNQQLSALPGIPQTEAVPAASNPAAASTSGTPQSFANTLQDALGDFVAPDAVTQALLSAGSALLSTVATGGTLELASDTAADDGNSSPESGNDLPPLSLATDSTSALAQALTTALGATDDLAAQPGLPDTTQNISDPNLATSDAVAQSALPEAALAAQLLAANATAGVSATAPAAARTSGAPSATASVSTFNTYNVAQDAPALALNAQSQTASQDQHGQQKHSPHDLELLTAVAAVLVPVKERSVEQFQLAVPATANALTPDAPNVNAGVSPLNSSVSLAANAATSISAPGKAELAIPQAPGQPGWGDVFADRVTFAVRQSLQEAEIRLNPPQLGQVDVRIVMSNDQANLMFSSPHGAVREAIELSIGRLRDMLADSGFNLVNVDVSDKSLAQQRNDAREQHASGRGGSQAGYRADFELAANAPEILRASGTGSIDYYV